MKIAMLILGIIGSLIALVGSLVTIIGGVGGTAVGVLAEHSSTATSGAYVFWSGVIAIVASAMALIYSIVGGIAKRKTIILIFAVATLVCGLINVYLYNWFSGLLVTVGGILGCVGAKDGIDDKQSLARSPMLYIIFSTLIVMIGAAILFKNGHAIVGDLNTSTTTEISTAATASPEPISPATQTQPTNNPPQELIIRSHGTFANSKATIVIELGARGEDELRSSLCTTQAFNPVIEGEKLSDSKGTYVFWYLQEFSVIEVESHNDCFPAGRYLRVK